MSAKQAIAIVKKTGDLTKAVCEALSGQRAYELKEELGAHQQKQVWFCPNQDALNQLILRIEDKLPDATYSVADSSNGAQSGYEISVSGVFSDQDVASLAAVKGVVRVDGPSQDLS